MIHREVLQYLHNPALPTHFKFINDILLPDPEKYPWIVATEVAGTHTDFARLGFRADGQCYARSNAVAIAAGADEFESEPVVGCPAFVTEERHSTVQLCDQ